MQSRALSAAEIGTAMHTIMQHIDIRKENSVTDVEQLVTELTDTSVADDGRSEVQLMSMQLHSFFEYGDCETVDECGTSIA